MTIPAPAHTPGPWFSQDMLEPMGNCLAKPILAQDTFIAHVVFDDEDDAEAEANARLIAAAPALLEVLQDLMSMRSQCFIPNDGSWWDDAARAAIAQAIGEA